MSPFARNAIVLGAVTAVGPFAIDMYLPAFARIAADLKTDQGAVQLSLVSFFVALALGQTVYGPVSDAVGRRKPLLFGMSLFIAASIGCGFAPNVGSLAALRFLEGAGACAGMVISRAVVRDLHTGHEAARLFATTLLVLGLSPIFAPLIGSLIVTQGSWRLIFVALSLIAAVAMLLVAFLLPETHRPQPGRALALAATFRAYRDLLRNPEFVSSVLTAGFAQASFFAYLAGSSFVFITVFGTSPFGFSLLFAMNAVAMIGGAQLAPTLVRRFGARRLIGPATAAYACFTVALLLANVLGLADLPVTVVLVFCSVGCLGFIMPPATMLSLEAHGAIAGTASSMMGTLQFTLGALSSFAVSLLFDGTARPLFLIMSGTAVASLISWRVFLVVAASRGRLPRPKAAH
jgi:DHA1 family bicyclomycin/chloramphenicol resistance-like MFS transporter